MHKFGFSSYYIKNKMTGKRKRLNKDANNKDISKKAKINEIRSPIKVRSTENGEKHEKIPSKRRSVKRTADKLTSVKNELSDVSDSGNSEDEFEMRSLEKRMKENVDDNAEFFAKLGMHAAKIGFDEVKDVKKVQPTYRGFKEKRKHEPVVTERRMSLRIQKKDPGGEELTEKPVVDIYTDFRIRKDGPLTMHDTLTNGDDDEGTHSEFLKSLQKLNNKEIKSTLKLDPELASFITSTDTMDINQVQVAKVVPHRIFSVAVHPTTEKVLLAAGDKRGNIGFWDVNSTSNQDGVFCYSPHVAPVKHMVFPTHQPHCLYSASYDGALRCCYFETGVFDEIYSTPYDENVIVTGFDFFSPTSMVVSQGGGGLVMVDTRVRSSSHTLHEISMKTTRSVSIHPVQRDYIATAHADSNVYIWDIRKLSTKKPKYIHNLQHSRIVESAFFSPISGQHLVTTADVYRLYNTSEVGTEAKLETNIRHNNHTGRWLSKFRAVWHPSRDDVFISGSMNKPRQIELFDTRGRILKVFQNQDYLCSVCSLNAFHPTQNILIGGNSSGRVHVFK